MSINGKNIHKIPEIGSCFYGDVNLTIRVFTWGLAKDLHISKQNMINLKNIILSNLRNNKISNLQCQSQCKNITVRLTT